MDKNNDFKYFEVKKIYFREFFNANKMAYRGQPSDMNLPKNAARSVDEYWEYTRLINTNLKIIFI